MRRAECWPRSESGGCRPLILLFKVGFSGFARHRHRSSCGGEGSRGGSWAAAGTCVEGDGDSEAAGLVARRWGGVSAAVSVPLLLRGDRTLTRGAVSDTGRATADGFYPPPRSRAGEVSVAPLRCSSRAGRQPVPPRGPLADATFDEGALSWVSSRAAGRIRTRRRHREGKPGKGSGCPLCVGRVLSDGPELVNSGSGALGLQGLLWVACGSPARARARSCSAGHGRAQTAVLVWCFAALYGAKRRSEAPPGRVCWWSCGVEHPGAELRWCLRGCTQPEGRLGRSPWPGCSRRAEHGTDCPVPAGLQLALCGFSLLMAFKPFWMPECYRLHVGVSWGGTSPFILRAPSRREMCGPGSSGHPGVAGGGCLAAAVPRTAPAPPQLCQRGLRRGPEPHGGVPGSGLRVDPLRQQCLSLGWPFRPRWKPPAGVQRALRLS